MSKKRIALIGGAGFIGHNLAVDLVKAGHEPFVIDSLHVNNLLSFCSTDRDQKHREMYIQLVNQRLDILRDHDVPVYVQDAREYHMLCKVLTEIKPDVVVLLAAVAHADRSNKDPMSTFDHSLRTLENALDKCKGEIEHFIYFSSSMIYGNFPNGEVSETTPCNPLGVYGALKYAGERIVIAYNQVFGLPYTIIRPSALYGERCVSRRVGQIFIESALEGKEITINGTGDDRLDFTYVGDVTQGVVRMIENPAAKGEIFNITYGESRSIADLAGVLQSRFPNANVRYLPKDKLTPARGTLCVDKARTLIGYDPQYPLEIGYTKYIDWYMSQWPAIKAEVGGARVRSAAVELSR